jgi:1-aminocyclopropane-1-carboxylate deaminase
MITCSHHKTLLTYNPVINKIEIANSNYQVDVLRLDQLHPEISGNKWFKLKYNLQKAQELGHNTILTFGGAFSNHIAATAAACKLAGLKSIAVIRGEETEALNSTLLKAREDGMQFYFVNREAYKKKQEAFFLEDLLKRFGPHYLIPEGGNNEEGLKGCMEILPPGAPYDYILCACGTATTFAGILASAKSSQTVIGISVLKGENALPEQATELLKQALPGSTYSIRGNEELEKQKIENSCITNNYCFNGYAGFDHRLVTFKNQIEKQYGIPLDHVYTIKLFYALFDLVEKQKFKPNARILVVHSGGLQGNAGFEKRFL